MAHHFVLIHGSWHGGWCWDGVVAELVRRGHRADAPTLPGSDGRPSPAVTFAHLVTAVRDAVLRAPKAAVLVGHSSAGILLQTVAPIVAHRLFRVVFLAGIAVEDGRTLNEMLPPDAAAANVERARTSGVNALPVDDAFVRAALFADEADAQRTAVIGRLTPQPFALYTERYSAAAFDALAEPKTAIICADDRSLGPDGYRNLARRVLGSPHLVEVPGSHEALVTNPVAIADALIRAAG
jgi:hypothetical protein